jgi:hypothetical protein
LKLRLRTSLETRCKPCTQIHWLRLGDSHMSYPYPSLYLDAERAKRRLAQSFRSGPDRRTDILAPPITKNAPAANDQREAAKQPRLSQELTRLRGRLSDLTRNAAPPKRSDGNGNDMSAFSFSLTLLLLGTVAAANTNRPVFWLLSGPAPLAAGFTVLTFFRQRISRRSSFVAFWQARFVEKLALPLKKIFE